jgi:hypothetical protein
MTDGERHALIVASDTHTDPRLSRLRAPAVDAAELARVLSDPAIGAFEVATSLNEPEHVVRRRLSAFFEDRGSDDLLVLHLSCHGVKDEDGRLYFATSDTEVEHLDATAIPADFVNRQMTRCRSRRIVLLLDCCYSGAFARGMVGRAGDRVDLKERFEGHGRIVLTASSAMEYSFEGDQTSGQGRPSVFTSAVVQGLATGEADRDRDGYVSVDELYDFAYEQVRTVTPSQTPGKWVFDVQGDFYLARSAAGLPTVVPGLPGDLGAAMVSPFARVRRGAVEELAGLLTNPDEDLATAAHAALVELTRDDSQDVSRAARGYVAEPEEPAPPQPAATSSAAEVPVTTEPVAWIPATPEPVAVPSVPAEPSGVVSTPPHAPAARPSEHKPPVAAQPVVPSWMPTLCRAGAVGLLAAAALPLLVDDTMTRWNLFAVMAPLVAVAASVLAWMVADGLRARRLPLPYAGGLLLALGALTAAGSAGLVTFAAEWLGGVAILFGGVALLGAVAALVVGISLVRQPPMETVGAAERSMMILALLGTVLTAVALFIPYDGSSSLWDEVIEGESAAFAYLPITAVLVLIVAVFLLGSRRRLAAGMLTATGVLLAVHFVGVLLAASFAIGEAGEVRAAWIVGVAGGALVGLAGWLTHRTDSPQTP